jgi:hypothetical protein
MGGQPVLVLTRWQRPGWVPGPQALRTAQHARCGISSFGGGIPAAEKQEILDDGRADVVALRALLPAMLPTIDWPRA